LRIQAKNFAVPLRTKRIQNKNGSENEEEVYFFHDKLFRMMIHFLIYENQIRITF
jgi:hypothetical protein